MTRLSLYMYINAGPSFCLLVRSTDEESKVFAKLTDVHNVAFIINTSGVSFGESLCCS